MTTANLTITDNETVIQYVSIGESSFIYDFPILANAEIKVSVDQVDQILGVDYTLTGVGDAGGGTVVFAVATTVGELITIWQEMPFKRLTGFALGAATLLPQDLNAEFARQVRHDQQVRRDIGRAIRLAIDDPQGGQDMIIPTQTARAGKVLGFDASGVPTVLSVVSSEDASLRADLASTAANFGWELVAISANAAELFLGTSIVKGHYHPGNILRYGAVDGQDSTVAFKAARDVVERDKSVSIKIPRGGYPITSEVLFTGSASSQDPDATTTARVTILGEGIDSVLKPTMTDGSACLSIQYSNWVTLRDFRVDTGERVNVAGGPLNCIGIEFLPFGSRADIQNVHVWGCATGWDIEGFILRAHNMWASHCNLGFNLDTINASNMVVSAENCVKTMNLVDSSGVVFPAYQDEGILFAGSGDPVPSTIDGCKGISFPGWRFEGNAVFTSANPRPTGYFKVGFTTACENISFRDGSCGSTDKYQHFIEFENTNGVVVTGSSFASFHTHASVRAGPGCSNVTIDPVFAKTTEFPVGEPVGFPVDDSLTVGPAYNYFPNSNLDLWFRGWDSVIVSNSTPTLDVARTGAHDGANDAAILTDSGESWVTNELVGLRIRNTTDGSSAIITANDTTTVTGVLSGGTDDDWDAADTYIIDPRVRRGANALRITCTAAGFNVVEFRIAGAAVTALRGKVCTLWVWAWIPDIAAYDDGDAAAQTAKASIILTSDGGGVASPTQNHHTMKGHWNLINVDTTIGDTATYISAAIYANQSAAVQTISEYIIVDSIFLTEGDSDSQSRKITNGEVVDSDLLMSRSVGGLLVQRTDTTPADADQTYVVGDRIEYEIPLASGFIGEFCETAGVGGVAVFKTYGVTSA